MLCVYVKLNERIRKSTWCCFSYLVTLIETLLHVAYSRSGNGGSVFSTGFVARTMATRSFHDEDVRHRGTRLSGAASRSDSELDSGSLYLSSLFFLRWRIADQKSRTHTRKRVSNRSDHDSGFRSYGSCVPLSPPLSFSCLTKLLGAL